jgi:hypothetical protein
LKFEIQSNSAIDKKLSVTGGAKLEWRIDENKIKTALVNKTKEEAKNILSSFAEISSAEIVLEPFWRSKFPKAEKINLIINK